MRILVVEDDVQLAEMLMEALTDRQYVVDVAQDGEAAWDFIKGLEYDLVVLDITLPKLDGVSFCQRLRSHNRSLPVLMLTARDTLADKVTGLDAGADDYMVKPFEMPELMARIRALLRRNQSASSFSDLSWGDLHLNSSTYEVNYATHPLHLTPKEFALLELMVSSGRRVLSRTGIIERIWSLNDPPSEETVKSHIKSLRNKLREAGAPDDLIETVHGLGYRLKQL
ncbi:MULTISPECIES: response regulator transcription factor [Calothrix]|uniref:Response regulator transcription factor n=2 Tax=Calothrix TaxID=1186 RepID=A0ABR8ACI6_9CYAN|nr:MULTISPECIES: response regulator transcription factor [Calothrix]MBD2197721.1 response regulator transcription factor [Calothrix parietina FACHB-288]MBD2205349.1 response regulator transcription factor [Calothrix sp. FACHB-168]MBD2218480.1 response regulator transcription factor [Calothrix sp. FACHB-1219]MBD2225650.1 response regulator transcription factor [Calothrix anomala FACHB-343]